MEYMGICSFMQIPNMVHIVIQKMIQATGNMIEPMLFQLTGVITNFIFDPLLIFGIGFFPAMGIKGAATATVLGYSVSMVLAFIMFLKAKHKIALKTVGFRFEWSIVQKIIILGLPSFIMNALNAFTITIVNLFLVAYSDTSIAFLGAYFKIQQLIIMTINGLIQGCLPIMRFNYGAGNLKRLQSVFRYSTILVTSLMMFGTLIIMLFPTQILSLFMASEKMRSYGIMAMRIMATGYLFCGLSTMISTYMQAIERVLPSIMIQIFRQMFF
jgi:Na+-driven multidrug efflux pump